MHERRPHDSARLQCGKASTEARKLPCVCVRPCCLWCCEFAAPQLLNRPTKPMRCVLRLVTLPCCVLSLFYSQHLSFLTGLPNLTVLTLHCDRIRLSLLPTALTKLDLEGLVQIDSGPAGVTLGHVHACMRVSCHYILICACVVHLCVCLVIIYTKQLECVSVDPQV